MAFPANNVTAVRALTPRIGRTYPGPPLEEVVLEKNNIERIRQTLKDIQAIRIESIGTFYQKGMKSYLDDNFTFYERVIFAGQKLPDGTEADAVYIMLGSHILDNINDGYTVPLDFGYMLVVHFT